MGRKLTQSAVGLFALAATPALAQVQGAGSGNAGNGLEEVVVTAQRRETKLQQTPVAITALSTGELERRQVQDVTDLGRNVPNLVTYNNTGLATAAQIWLRGLGQDESISSSEPAVGVYIDGVYVARQGSSNFQLFDVESIQVLRGPQGTLYGRNTPGGAVLVTTKKPTTDVLEGSLEAQIGDYSTFNLRGSVNVPINDKIAARFTAYSQKRNEGFVDNLAYPDGTRWKKDVQGGRFALRFLPTDDLDITFYADYAHDSSDPPAAFNPANPPYGYGLDPATRASYLAGGSRGGTNLIPFTTGTPTQLYRLDDYKIYDAYTSYQSSVNKGLSLNVKYTLPWATITSITAGRAFDQQYAHDFLASPNVTPGQYFPGYGIPTHAHYRQFSQELQLTGKAFGDRLNYVVGLFYFNEDNRNALTTYLGSGLLGLVGTPLPPGIRVPGFGAQFQYLTNTAESYAGFGEATYDVTDRLQATAGLRYTYEKKKLFSFGRNLVGGTFNGTDIVGFTFDNTPANGNTGSGNWNLSDIRALGVETELHTYMLTPRVSLQYTVVPDVNVYASWARGFRSPGWNTRNTSLGGFANFLTEKNDTFEVGVKSEWLDRQLRVNVTGFYMDYTNLIVTDAPAPGVFSTPNADVEYKGIEGEIQAAPKSMPGLTLFANFGLQEAHYKALRGFAASSFVTLDTPPKRVPNFTGTAGFNYQRELQALGMNLPGDLILNASYGWTGRFNDGVSGQPWERVKGLETVNAGIGWENASLRVMLTCNNCTDDRGYHSTLFYQQFLDAPRTILGSIRWKFGGSRPATTPVSAAPAPAPQRAIVPRTYLVFFDFDQSDLTPEGSKIVQTAAANSRSASVTRIEVTGHADRSGSDQYNLRLSERRARTVQAALVQAGVPADQIALYAKGESQPLVPTADGVREPQNRRVEIVYR